jgi:ACT domain-containing protein
VLEGTTILWIDCLLEFSLKHVYNSKETVRNSKKIASQKLVKNDSAGKVNISRTANYFYRHVLYFSLTYPRTGHT